MLSLLSFGQTEDSLVVLTKNFKFEDGIYLSFEDFQQNKPSYTWDTLGAKMFSNPQNAQATLDSLWIKGIDPEIIPIDQLWGICLAGIPYIRLEKGAIKDDRYSFVGLKVRGKICYFSYRKTEVRKIAMPIYNPYTRRPFQQGYVEREKTFDYKKILSFESGAIADFDRKNFVNWIYLDWQLQDTVKALSEDEVSSKLFKCLLIYVDRNEVKIPYRSVSSDES